MTNRLYRLACLVRAQNEFAKALEAKLARQESGLAGLIKVQLEVSRLADVAAGEHPEFLPKLLHKLAEIEQKVKESMECIENLQRELFSTGVRQKIVTARHSSLQEAVERKYAESQSLEAALVMAAKASRKNDMVS